MIIQDENTWPEDVLEYLREHEEIFRDWERGQPASRTRKYSGKEYDAAVRGFREILNRHVVRGYHCTRLTRDEINTIQKNGMHLPNLSELIKRIDALEKAELVTPEIAKHLKENNAADEDCRANMLWFSCFPPCGAEQDGIEGFFRYWGGEALYRSHLDRSDTKKAISSIGIPCIVEAELPIASLDNGFLEENIARVFLINRGLETREPTEHEDHLIAPLSADKILRIIEWPAEDFINLSKCNEWKPPLK